MVHSITTGIVESGLKNYVFTIDIITRKMHIDNTKKTTVFYKSVVFCVKDNSFGQNRCLWRNTFIKDNGFYRTVVFSVLSLCILSKDNTAKTTIFKNRCLCAFKKKKITVLCNRCRLCVVFKCTWIHNTTKTTVFLKPLSLRDFSF